MLKVMTRLMSIRKASNTIYTRFNTGNEGKDSSARIIQAMEMVIKMGKSSDLNTRTRRDIKSNTIIQYNRFQHSMVNYVTGLRF